MTSRQRPPDRRIGPLVTYKVDEMEYIAQAYESEPGRIAEMFINCGKEGSSANIVARECAVILSIALQYGTPLDAITKALPLLSNGKPAGPVGCALFLFANPTISPYQLDRLRRENGRPNNSDHEPDPPPDGLRIVTSEGEHKK